MGIKGRAAAALGVLTVTVALMPACTLSPPETAATPTGSGTSPTTAPEAGSITPIGMMAWPRAVQSSTRLQDGRVLIAGGCSDAGCELGSAGGSTAEVFDPTTDAFRTVGGLDGFRDDHGAVPLRDGRVLIAGGWGVEGVMRTTELFDATTGRFSAGPPMTAPRAGFTPVMLKDGRVLLTGGFLDNEPTTAKADVFDPAAGTMSPTGSMGAARGAYAAARLRDGRVLIAGGMSSGHVLASAELYDPQTGRFAPTGGMGIARYKAAAVTLPDGKVMVIGGAGDVEGNHLYASTELYDPQRGTFSSGPNMQWPRYKLAGSVVRLPDGSVLVAGGAQQAERYDPITGSFEEIPGALGGDRLFLAASLAGQDQVLITGGYDASIVPTDQAWLYMMLHRG